MSWVVWSRLFQMFWTHWLSSLKWSPVTTLMSSLKIDNQRAIEILLFFYHFLKNFWFCLLSKISVVETFFSFLYSGKEKKKKPEAACLFCSLLRLISVAHISHCAERSRTSLDHGMIFIKSVWKIVNITCQVIQCHRFSRRGWLIEVSRCTPLVASVLICIMEIKWIKDNIIKRTLFWYLNKNSVFEWLKTFAWNCTLWGTWYL